jgi:hypothetical protein
LYGSGGKRGVISRVEVPQGLYDLAHDPGEAYDVQSLYPEMVTKLRALAEEARQELGDDLTTGKVLACTARQLLNRRFDASGRCCKISGLLFKIYPSHNVYFGRHKKPDLTDPNCLTA